MKGRNWLVAMWVFVAAFFIAVPIANTYGVGHQWPLLVFLPIIAGFVVCAIVTVVRSS